jgi:O-antigen/teichoic acid export membrane protein
MIGVTLVSRCIYLLLIIFLVHDNESAIWAFLAQGINMGIITIYAYFRMCYRYNYRFENFQFNSWLNTLKQSFPFLINAITNNQINTLWGFGLSLLGGPQAMAIFNIGDQIYRAGGAITNVIAQATRIHFYGHSLKNIKFTFIFFVIFFLLFSICVVILAPRIIQQFFSENFLPAINVLQVMMVAWCMHAIVKLLNYPILGETHGAGWVNKITYKILILHFIFFLIWIYFFNSPLSLVIMFSLVIGCQLIIFLFHFFRKNTLG